MRVNATLWTLLLLVKSAVLMADEKGTSRFDVEVHDALKNGMLLRLPFDSGFGDESKHNHGSKIIGDVKVLPGEGAYFDGDGDWIELPSLDLANKPFAISFWIKVSGDFGGYGVFQQRSGGGKREWLHFVLRNPMCPHLGFYMADLRSKSMIRKIDGWRHVALQYRDGKSEIWLDGQLDCSAKKDPFLGKKGKFLIGKAPRWGNVPMSDFQGYLRDFRVYDRALSSVEVGALALPF